ncbi:uncharacterized protein LOC121112454 [Gallus gallus]|uniref:uncharacterized protein LOC121112454 n=1 Tax=Gallus gallus TaxID=9031 RepID=UPI001F006D02|nr:uncharacterized protein LOC121112454 [Gallus gallus]
MPGLTTDPERLVLARGLSPQPKSHPISVHLKPLARETSTGPGTYSHTLSPRDRDLPQSLKLNRKVRSGLSEGRDLGWSLVQAEQDERGRPAARRASRATDTNTEERVAVWDAVAAYVQEHLLVQKGVWIPTFGSFDTISKDIRTADGTVTLRWPVFQLARNLRAMHHLGSDKDSLPAHREVETLKYSEVAAAASVTWQRGKTCIQSTVSLLSNCLKNGGERCLCPEGRRSAPL